MTLLLYIISSEVILMLNENHNIEKSMALVWAKLTDYGAGELKILDTYLSRINARNPESSRVTFTKREYAGLMGLDADIRTSQLKACTTKLLKNVVSIDFPDGSGYDQYPLFYKATTKMDKELGQVVIQIECHPELKEAFFDIAKDRYITYQLKNTIALKSQYSIRLYCALMAKQKYGWKVGVDELRERLCATNPAYKEFKRFNNLVLKKAIEEINAVTNIRVETEYIRKGRSIAFIQFTVEVIKSEPDESTDEPELLDAPDPEALPAVPELPESKANKGVEMVLEVLPEGFTQEQAELLYSLASDYVPYTVLSFDEKHNFVSDFVQSKVRLMRTQRKPVAKNAQFSWLRKAVEKDWK